jgi:thiol-disulfide isomerase/thioredoxin
MIPLLTQEEFETLRATKHDKPVLIYFTAAWCGPCRAFDWDSVKGSLQGYTIYLCDVDANTYTPGYCGVRSIPNFFLLKTDSSFVGPRQISNSTTLLEWLKESS